MITRIPDNTFAAACYDQNSIDELRASLTGAADEADMNTWRLTVDEWREEIEMALQAKLADATEAPIAPREDQP